MPGSQGFIKAGLRQSSERGDGPERSREAASEGPERTAVQGGQALPRLGAAPA